MTASSQPSSEAAVASAVSSESPVSPSELAAAARSFSTVPGPPNRLKRPTCPRDGARNILVTSALPYVNNVPHLGNIVGCVLSADVFARFCRLRGYNTLYICGTDEYGTATETKAMSEGVTPRQIVDKYHAIHAEVYEWFGISFDHFGRTTTKEQTKITQDIFWSLHKAGKTREDSMEQLYCAKCDKFLADRFVEGTCPMCAYPDARGDQCDGCGKLINAVELVNPRCKLGGKECSGRPEVRTSKHVFIDLPAIEAEWAEWMETSSKGWSSNAREIAKSWLKTRLQPRCITRDLKWGTPVPLDGYKDKVFYVWFDAPIGYISITACYTDEWEKWWKDPDRVEYFEFMAKDNVAFHSVVFPATLLGTGEKWTKVNRLMSTEYLNYEDAKFSKSRGIGVFGDQAKETGIDADVFRFYLTFIRPENQDSAFQWEDLTLKTNSELLGNLGNFVNRALKFCNDNFEGKVMPIRLNKDDTTFVAQVNRHLERYIALLEDAKERDAVREMLAISRLGNQLMQSNKPWKLVKSGVESDHSRAGSVVGLCVNAACLLSVIMSPFMPGLARRLQQQLNVDPSAFPVLGDKFSCLLAPGHKIGTPEPLVRELKSEEAAALKKKYQGKKAVTPPKDQAAAPADAAGLEAAVAAQGDKVRTLKASGAEKDIVKAEVATLLGLKQKLVAITGDANAADAGGKGSKGKSKSKKK